MQLEDLKENVLLCRLKDPDDLAASMQTVTGDSVLRKNLSFDARELTQEWFSWEKAIERTLQTLKG